MTGFDIWNELGNTYFKAEAYDDAIDAYSKAIELNPGFGWAYSNLALAYTRKGKLTEAIHLYQKSIQLLPEKVDQAISWNRLGDAYRQLNEYDNAAAAYEAADRLSPHPAATAVIDTLPVQEAVSSALGGPADEKKPGAAVDNPPLLPQVVASARHLAGIHQVDLDNAHIWNELGNIFLRAGAYDDAAETYKKAIQLDPAFGWPYSNLGLTCTLAGSLNEAIPLYKKSIMLFTNNKDKAVSWNRLGDAYRRLHIYKDAIAAYEVAKKLTRENEAPRHELCEASIEQIALDPRQAQIRAGVDELAESIRVHGVIEPLVVCPKRDEPGRYTLVAGRRRLEAARQAGLETVPVIVRQVGEREALEMTINLKVHRADPNPLELAEAYRRLMDEFDLSEEEIAASIGKTRYTVGNALRLLSLPEDVKQAIACRRISETHARFLFILPSAEMQSTALQSILRNELSVPPTKDLVRRLSSIRAASPAVPAAVDPAQEPAAAPSQKPDDYRPENISLMDRARFMLMSNPRVGRNSQPVSS